MAHETPPRVRYYTAQSLDGYIAETDHSLAWLLEHDSRTTPADASAGAVPLEGHYERFFAGVGAVVTGARTYEWGLDHDSGWPYPGVPTWVLSHRALPVADGADVRVVDLPAADTVRQALDAAAGRDVWLLGGGPVAQDVLDAGLLHTVEVTVVPVVLGAGVPLFGGRVEEPLVLTGVTPFANGMVHLQYRVVGAAPRQVPAPIAAARG